MDQLIIYSKREKNIHSKEPDINSFLFSNHADRYRPGELPMTSGDNMLLKGLDPVNNPKIKKHGCPSVHRAPPDDFVGANFFTLTKFLLNCHKNHAKRSDSI